MSQELSKEEMEERIIEMTPDKVDQNRVQDAKKRLEKAKKDVQGKEYALPLTEAQMKRFETYISEEAEWRGKESLGIIEILKRVKAAKKEGRKDGVYYFNNLEIEASHYFLNKWSGKGVKDAEEFVGLIKGFEDSLSLIHQDNQNIKDLEKELAAAEQGLEMA
jgi:hypothetical protein